MNLSRKSASRTILRNSCVRSRCMNDHRDNKQLERKLENKFLLSLSQQDMSLNIKKSPGMSNITPVRSPSSFISRGTSGKSNPSGSNSSRSRIHLSNDKFKVASRHSLKSGSDSSFDIRSHEEVKRKPTIESSQSGISLSQEINYNKTVYETTYQALLKKYASREDGLPDLSEYLEVFIIDQNQPYKIIPEYNWKRLEANINQAILKQLRTDATLATPIFTIKGYYRGHKIIQCDNEKSLQFLQNYINSCKKPWNRAKLLVVHRDGIPIRPRGVISVNDPRLSLDELQTLLRAQNKGIETEDLICKRFTDGRKKNSRLVVIEFGQSAQNYIEKNKGKVKFGFDYLKVHFLSKQEMEDERSNLFI